MSPASKISKMTLLCGVAAVLIAAMVQPLEAKLLGRQRFYEDSYGEGGPYGGATGERAIITVRGARNPYSGHAPGKMAIEDDPYRGPYPRGVYDRLDSGYGRGGLRPMPYGGYPQTALGGYGGYSGFNGGGYGGYGGYNSGR